MNRAAAVVQKIMYTLFEFCINYWGIKFLRVWILLQDLFNHDNFAHITIQYYNP